MTKEIIKPFRIIRKHYVFSVSMASSGEDALWSVDDGEFVYTHFFQFGFVTESPKRKTKSLISFAIQLVVGPVLFSLAFVNPK